MNQKYTRLLEALQLPNGITLPNRLVMAPMVVKGAHEDGTISQLDINYFEKRSDVAGLIITGASYVTELGCGFEGQIAIDSDKKIEGLSKIAAAAKKDGNKVVVQLYHAGREGYYEKLGKVVAPSAIKFPFLDYVPEELTATEIDQIIQDFGLAAKRAIDAGFDGVEIHGANHYLLQQFFSAYSNQRTDQWGGSLENRIAFPLAILKEVRRVVEEAGRSDFIVGYRLCPEEIHGDVIGYTVDDCLQLIEALLTVGLDYLHLSVWTGFDARPEGATHSFGNIVREKVQNRCPVIIVSNVTDAADALHALEHGDLVAIGRAALVEPEFARKIKSGLAGDIATTIENRLEQLALPPEVIDWFLMDKSPLPPLPGIESVRPLSHS